MTIMFMFVNIRYYTIVFTHKNRITVFKEYENNYIG